MNISDNHIPVRVDKLCKYYGAYMALDNVSFEAEPGSIVALLGPSGCGKTTTLRCIAGLEIPESGRIVIGDHTVNSGKESIYVEPNNRQLGMVFQSYAIWPHMNVFDNVAYPLMVKGVTKADIRRRVEETLEVVGLSGMGDRPSANLSGGQQQRVAIGRAIVGRPRVLLFDEPLSNLDAKLRGRMRYEIVKLQRELGLTSVFVTHDQSEAMAIADKIIVMNKGKIEQIGKPRSVYETPASIFVADFLGSPNILKGTLKGLVSGKLAKVELAGSGKLVEGRLADTTLPDGAELFAVIRPECFRLVPPEQAGSETNSINVSIEASQYLGTHLEVVVKLADEELRVSLPSGTAVGAGDQISLGFDASDCMLLPH